MDKIEIIRNELHKAIDRGNPEEIQRLSEKMDKEIIAFIREYGIVRLESKGFHIEELNNNRILRLG